MNKAVQGNIQSMRQKLIDSLSAQMTHLFEGARELPGQHEFQQQIRTLVQGTFARLDLVTREEFDAQRAVLARTRELVEKLEQRVAELERQPAAAEAEQPGHNTPDE